MGVEVEFITLGDASERLNTPPATLRNWTDQLEELNVHFVLRNNRNERIYQDTDLEIFAYMRDLKEEFGRRTTTKDIAYMILEKGERGELKLRSEEDAPKPLASNRTAELLGQEDIKRLMESERVRQFMEIISENIGHKLNEELDRKFTHLNNEMEESSKKIEKRLEEQIEINKRLEKKLEEQEKRWDERATELSVAMKKLLEENRKKGFFARLFGKD
jgi:DNA-binding transcriptional MerR regulator